ncbi:site-2 protease family protein [Ornithinibacillus halotolerans]|uniref:Peptidase M50 domain-containing protein n=1 Tax=Ornithinibacillus halotolerans TaxID=1274357 RepID=A0A916RKP2_9BACI|nr:site-2 protease family protein [Ornithinibacillus halotolerans]GGA60925.1 hypothetical protein GCM10008025_01170 [Ornithinibacillus halotolerans]
MNTFILFVYLLFVVAPLSNLVHELGHLIGAKLAKADSITLLHGRGRTVQQFSFKNINIQFGWLFFTTGLTKSNREQAYHPNEKIYISFMGPFFNGIIVFIFYFLYQLLPNAYISLVVLYNSWLFIMNIIPFKIGKQRSDGYIIIREIFRKMYTSR